LLGHPSPEPVGVHEHRIATLEPADLAGIRDQRSNEVLNDAQAGRDGSLA
jgi:hypothetical protein